MPTSHQYPTRSRQEAVRVGTGKAKEQAWGLMIRLAVLLVPWVAPSQVLHLDSQSTTMGARTRSGGGLQKSDVAWATSKAAMRSLQSRQQAALRVHLERQAGQVMIATGMLSVHPSGRVASPCITSPTSGQMRGPWS